MPPTDNNRDAANRDVRSRNVRSKDERRWAALAALAPGTMLRDGLEAGIHWMRLMEWNDLNRASRSCASQPTGAGSRKACSYLLWDAPSPNEPPQQ